MHYVQQLNTRWTQVSTDAGNYWIRDDGTYSQDTPGDLYVAVPVYDNWADMAHTPGGIVGINLWGWTKYAHTDTYGSANPSTGLYDVAVMLADAAQAAGLPDYDFTTAATAAASLRGPQGWSPGDNLFQIYNTILAQTNNDKLMAYRVDPASPYYQQGAQAGAARDAGIHAAWVESQAYNAAGNALGVSLALAIATAGAASYFAAGGAAAGTAGSDLYALTYGAEQSAGTVALDMGASTAALDVAAPAFDAATLDIPELPGFADAIETASAAPASLSTISAADIAQTLRDVPTSPQQSAGSVAETMQTAPIQSAAVAPPASVSVPFDAATLDIPELPGFAEAVEAGSAAPAVGMTAGASALDTVKSLVKTGQQIKSVVSPLATALGIGGAAGGAGGTGQPRPQGPNMPHMSPNLDNTATPVQTLTQYAPLIALGIGLLSFLRG